MSASALPSSEPFKQRWPEKKKKKGVGRGQRAETHAHTKTAAKKKPTKPPIP